MKLYRVLDETNRIIFAAEIGGVVAQGDPKGRLVARARGVGHHASPNAAAGSAASGRSGGAAP